MKTFYEICHKFTMGIHAVIIMTLDVTFNGPFVFRWIHACVSVWHLVAYAKQYIATHSQSHRVTESQRHRGTDPMRLPIE